MARNAFNLFASVILTARGLCGGICHAAKAGRLLPRLTLVMAGQIFVHCVLLASRTGSVVVGAPTIEEWKALSACFMTINAALNVVGYAVLVLIYRHSIQTIFNRSIPRITLDDEISPTPHPALESFNTHLIMLRPLEILFRFVTAPLRVLPDVIVLGETRCGTTNLCGHIVSLSSASSSLPERGMKVKVCTPFCAWAHPELDHKESFYFVGHYLGELVVNALLPYVITKLSTERLYAIADVS